jgi:small-conductance mechanosensitive channel
VSLARRITPLLLVILLAVVAAGVFATRPREEGPATSPAATRTAGSAAAGAPQPAAAPGRGPAPARRQRLVDMRPLLTARQLSAFAATPEEQELSRQAERLADHATDLAFVVAIRDAAESVPQTPELRALADARDAAQKAIDAAQARVRELELRIPASPERDRDALRDRIEVARAELELRRDELATASDALQRAGGDPQVRIRRLREVYDAAQKEPRPPAAAPPVAGAASSVAARLGAWTWHRSVLAQLGEARSDILDRAQRLAARRADLAARVERDRAGHPAAGDPAARPADDPRRLAAMGRRVQDLQELGETYGAWIAVVEGHVRAALHRLLWGVLGLVALLAVGFVAGEIVERLFRGAAREKLRVETLRTVARLGVNVVTLLIGLFLVFGAPAQATTVLGLAGAGLTVALKDFIVAFFGWFILMGRNGIRVGDWVEIKGVGGEVVEIGLFHTVLLETGSWNDAGHPTGRRASFVNSFAIEGHYFNFSTSGQWMWDELRLLIPVGRDPYPIIDGVQHLVEKETKENAKLAESEWRTTTSRYRVQTFSAVPGLQVVPAANGIEVVVRYITRAHERHDSRRRLYQAVVELMHGRRGAEAQGGEVEVG